MDALDEPGRLPELPLHIPPPMIARLKLTRPDRLRPDYWLLTARVGADPPDSTEYHMTTAGLRSFLDQVSGAIPGEDDWVQLMIGGLRLTFAREQWPRIQDYFSLFEDAARER